MSNLNDPVFFDSASLETGSLSYSDIALKELRVLHLVKQFSPVSQTFIYDLICGLESGYPLENTVYCYKRRVLAQDRPFARVLERKSVEKTQLTIVDRVLHLKRKEKLRGKAFKRFLHDFKPDIIHAHFAWCAWDYLCPAYLKLKQKIPLLISTHGSDIAVINRLPKAKQTIVELGKLDHVSFAVTTNLMQEQLVSIGISERKIRQIPNAVSPEFYDYRKRKVNHASDEFRIINNSRFVPWKGHRVLLSAFAQVIHVEKINATLTLIGEGPTRDAMVGLAQELGISNRVNFVGPVIHGDLPKLLAQHDLYIQPSTVDTKTGQLESFGLAVLEAVCVGLPVIVTNTGGLPSVIGEPNEFALLVEKGSVRELQAAIKQVFHSKVYTKRNDAYAHQKSLEFSRSNQLDACYLAYQELCSV